VNGEIVKRSDHAKGFVTLPKRWVVERTFAWLGRCKRLAKDWENLNRNVLHELGVKSAGAAMGTVSSVANVFGRAST
jgi:transposase